MIIMGKSIICYSLGNIKPKKRTKFNKELYGYIDKSNHSKYTYKREGLLEKIPNIKLARAVVVIRPSDEQEVIKVLKQIKAKYSSYDIIFPPNKKLD